MPAPKDTNGPVNSTGPNKGKNRARNKNGKWRKKRDDTGKSREKKKGCFITSVACHYKSLPDDCYELRTMREFRDVYLMQSSEGQKLVNEYYEIAPYIAANLRKTSDLEYAWRELNSCINHIEDCSYESAIAIYREMVFQLANRVAKNDRITRRVNARNSRV